MFCSDCRNLNKLICRNRKIKLTLFGEKRGEYVFKTIENRVLNHHVSTCLSLIVAIIIVKVQNVPVRVEMPLLNQ